MAKLKPGWRRVRLGEVARLVTDRCDPAQAGIERFVGLEHLEPGDLRIRSWGEVANGTTFTNRFRPGQVLFGKRRAYQRKVAVSDFEGVCSGDIYVLESIDPGRLLPELLPFICQTDAFFEHAVGTSAGSLSPRTNWTSLEEYEFALPPMEEQQQVVQVLLAAEISLQALRDSQAKALDVYQSASMHAFCRPHSRVVGVKSVSPSDWAPQAWGCKPLGELNDRAAPICYGIVQLGEPISSGVPVLRTQNLNGDYVQDMYYVSQAVDENYRRSRVHGGDILVAIQGVSTGKIGMVPVDFEGNINRHLARIRLGESLLAEFFFHLWRSTPFTAYMRSVSVGTTKPELTIGDLRKMLVPVPPLREQKALAKELSTLESCSYAIGDRISRVKGLQREILRSAWGT